MNARPTQPSYPRDDSSKTLFIYNDIIFNRATCDKYGSDKYEVDKDIICSNNERLSNTFKNKKTNGKNKCQDERSADTIQFSPR